MNKDEFQRAAFEKMLEGNGLSLRELFRMGLSAFLDPFRFIFVLMPGASGYALRRIGYKLLFKDLGKINYLLKKSHTKFNLEQIHDGENYFKFFLLR